MGNRGVCLSAANKPFLQKLSSMLQLHTVSVLGMASTDDMAIRLCHSLYPDALITHQFLSHGSGFVAAQALLGHTPSIVLCQRGEADYPVAEGIYTMFLPVSASGLLEKISEATEFGRDLRVATHQLKLTEQRDVIVRAKQWLMQTQGMTEPQAHATLQRISMDERLKLFEAAQKVLRRTGNEP